MTSGLAFASKPIAAGRRQNHRQCRQRGSDPRWSNLKEAKHFGETQEGKGERGKGFSSINIYSLCALLDSMRLWQSLLFFQSSYVELRFLRLFFFCCPSSIGLRMFGQVRICNFKNCTIIKILVDISFSSFSRSVFYLSYRL